VPDMMDSVVELIVRSLLLCKQKSTFYLLCKQKLLLLLLCLQTKFIEFKNFECFTGKPFRSAG